MPNAAPPENILQVSREEDGLKLLRFLQRRLPGPPAQGLLHKWIRSGQVRVNKGRSKAFSLLAAGDEVRLPPFAVLAPVQEPGPKGVADAAPVAVDAAPVAADAAPVAADAAPVAVDAAPVTADAAIITAQLSDLADAACAGAFFATPAPALTREPGPGAAFFLRRLADEGIGSATMTERLLLLDKPGGLAVQSGTGQVDSVAEKLGRAWQGFAYTPAPVHRLDRHTSGLLLAGLDHRSQQALHKAFAGQGITKDYLAWVCGAWAEERPCLLVDHLYKARERSGGGREYMYARAGGLCLPPDGFPDEEARGKGFAAALVVPVCRLDAASSACRSVAARENREYTHGEKARARENKGASLMLVRLLTGRTHQIRVQFSSRGFPLIGDGRYGGPSFRQMLLHAWQLILPEALAGKELCRSANGPEPGIAAHAPPGSLSFRVAPPWGSAFMPDIADLDRALQRITVY